MKTVIRKRCETCNRQLRFPVEHAGEIHRCPACRSFVECTGTIDEDDAEPEPEPTDDQDHGARVKFPRCSPLLLLNSVVIVLSSVAIVWMLCTDPPRPAAPRPEPPANVPQIAVHMEPMPERPKPIGVIDVEDWHRMAMEAREAYCAKYLDSMEEHDIGPLELLEPVIRLPEGIAPVHHFLGMSLRILQTSPIEFLVDYPAQTGVFAVDRPRTIRIEWNGRTNVSADLVDYRTNETVAKNVIWQTNGTNHISLGRGHYFLRVNVSAPCRIKIFRDDGHYAAVQEYLEKMERIRTEIANSQQE